MSALTTPTQVTAFHVQPGSGHQPVVDEIELSHCSIDINMYMFTDATIVDALERAVGRGIRVRVILEKHPFGTFGDQQEMFDRLDSLGIQVKWSSETFTYSHAKYMIVDSQVLLVTNQNFTGAGFDGNREFGVVTTDPRYVLEAQMVFDADWNQRVVSFEVNHLIVSPINSRERILDLINSSETSVWMYSEVLRDEDITSALSSAADRGVDVRILVNPTTDEDDVPYFLDVFSHGVQVRVLRDPYVHAKLMIVDGARALVGSQNYSYTSLNLNREVGLIVDDPYDLAHMKSVYEGDWAKAEPVDSIARTKPPSRSALTRPGLIGRISSVRWRVV